MRRNVMSILLKGQGCLFNNSGLLKKIDFTLLITVYLIIIIGLVVIYSATKPVDINSVTGDAVSLANSFEELKKQILWIVLGSVMLLAIVLNLYHEDLLKHTRLLYVINLLMLSTVIFFGYSELGAQRWISIFGFAFQPSEFSKLLIIICFAAFLSKRKKKLESLIDLLPCFAYILAPVLMILMQPDLGTALVFFAVMFGMLFTAGANPRLLLAVIATSISAVSLWIWLHIWLAVNRGIALWIPLKEYQLNRLIIFLDPWKDPAGDGYHIIQSLIAIGQGGFWGRGLLQGSQTHGDFLPIQESDFIFSVIGEEFGFIGAIVLLGLYFIVIYRGILVTVNAKDDFGTLLASGVVSMLTFHVLVNVGMTSGIMPVTGIPLPMVSYGGSSMLTNLMALGVLLSINVRRRKMFL